jgi:histidinol phosphatase-like PHP family hydrolase
MKPLHPALVPLQDFLVTEVPQVDYHLHTSWTDGAHSALEMHESAIQNGLSAVLFSEHARKTSEDWFYDFAAEIRSLPQDRCRALVGVEAKVLGFDGEIDSTPGICGTCDLVMASVHRLAKRDNDGVEEFGESNAETALETELEMALAVLDNPAVHILGHPFGMSMTRFDAKPSDSQYKAVIAKAAETGVAFEVNSYYHPNPWQLIRWCHEAGARISLGSNAHHIDYVGSISNRLIAEAED